MRDQVKQARASLRQFIPIIRYELLTKLRQMLEFSVVYLKLMHNYPSFRPAMFARYCDTRGMDHVRLDPSRLQPARQPEAVAAGFEGNRNPRDRAASPDCLVAPAMQ